MVGKGVWVEPGHGLDDPNPKEDKKIMDKIAEKKIFDAGVAAKEVEKAKATVAAAAAKSVAQGDKKS